MTPDMSTTWKCSMAEAIIFHVNNGIVILKTGVYEVTLHALLKHQQVN